MAYVEQTRLGGVTVKIDNSRVGRKNPPKTVIVKKKKV
jgi:hypothetical protein